MGLDLRMGNALDRPHPPSNIVGDIDFPGTLEEQEAALATNPLMRRLIQSRTTYAGDRHRPAYHYVNPEAGLNDPNGLCYWQGNWHLFYQAYPPEDTRQHWGHAISDDPLLRNWTKVGDGAVIPLPDPDAGAPYRVFDPCIWKKDGLYYSLSAGTKPEGPAGKPVRANLLFMSEDLEHWTYLHPFVEDDAFTLVGDDGACPYFWPIGDRHILLFFSHMSGGQYLLGDYDTGRDKFVVTKALLHGVVA